MLLDISGLLSLQYKSEPFHKQAQSIYQRAASLPTYSLITHSYVLAEYVALTNARRFPRRRSLIFAKALMDHPEIDLVWVDEALHRVANAFLLMRQDKEYSLCDAISFELMRRYSITEALTTDKHFEQAGFVRLLRDF